MDSEEKVPVFRARKRQKFERKFSENQFEPEDGLSIADVLRARKKPKHRGGLGFSSTEPSRARTSSSETIVVMEDQAQTNSNPFAGRFVAQTGKVADVEDKQMNEWVEVQWQARQQNKILPPSTVATRLLPITSTAPDSMIPPISHNDPPRERQPAGLGKLQEIDLGPDATARNIERTEAARRRLESGQDSIEEQPPEKARLGKDGRPWRRRKRRNSDDLRRDQLVDQILKEAKLNHYEHEPAVFVTGEGDQAADDILAERFRQEYLDSIESRNIQQRKPPIPPGIGTKKGEDKTKGPKLGGSRSARAAMRAQEELAAKAKKG